MKRTAYILASWHLLGATLLAQTPITSSQAWPRPIPCRIQDGANQDLFVMTLGNVATPIADGVFDPVKDEVTLNDGSVKKNYYRDVLGMKQYQPLDRSTGILARHQTALPPPQSPPLNPQTPAAQGGAACAPAPGTAGPRQSARATLKCRPN